jgi:hypothetical protein
VLLLATDPTLDDQDKDDRNRMVNAILYAPAATKRLLFLTAG